MATPTDEEFHQQMADAYSKQRRATPEPSPQGIDPKTWKNRHLVSAKLRPGIYADLMHYCRQQNMSINTAINTIIQTHFGTTNA